MTTKQAFLPLFFGDLLASTATWEGEERALYILLLAYQWTSGPLPKDERRLARMCQYDPKTFSQLWQVVGRKFPEGPDGLCNPRLEQHRARAVEIANKRATAGAKGGATTQAKTKQMLDGCLSTETSNEPSNDEASGQANARNLPGHPIRSDPIRSDPTQTVEPRAKSLSAGAKRAAPTDDPDFALFRSLYPDRGGDQRWRQAASAARARLAEGHSWQQIHDGARRYAEYCRATGKVGTEYVKQAASFLGPENHFLEPWTPPATKADVRLASNLDAAAEFMRRTEHAA